MSRFLGKDALDFYMKKFDVLGSPKHVLSKVLEYDFNACKTKQKNKEIQLFIENFYIASEHIIETANKIVARITDPDELSRFIYIHGYGSNGKTSFANYLKYKFFKEN